MNVLASLVSYPMRTRCQRIASGALLVAACWPWFAPAGEGGPLHRTLELRGEHAEVALGPKSISLFSNPPERSGVAPSVMSRRLVGDKWEGIAAHLDVSAAVLPGLCDRLNQINDESWGSLAGALPKGARIKSVSQTNRWAVVVYAAADEPVEYSINIAVFEGRTDDPYRSYRLVQTEKVSEGNFCGIYQYSGKAQLHFLALVDEPAGSSDYLAVYGYSIAR